jgi:hypothetical protein
MVSQLLKAFAQLAEQKCLELARPNRNKVFVFETKQNARIYMGIFAFY